jgi:hypothetical protein
MVPRDPIVVPAIRSRTIPNPFLSTHAATYLVLHTWIARSARAAIPKVQIKQYWDLLMGGDIGGEYTYLVNRKLPPPFD